MPGRPPARPEAENAVSQADLCPRHGGWACRSPPSTTSEDETLDSENESAQFGKDGHVEYVGTYSVMWRITKI